MSRCYALLVLLMAVAICFAETKGSISGKVTDISKNAISKVVVNLNLCNRTVTTKKDSTGRKVLIETTVHNKHRFTKTNKDGIYELKNAEPGDYFASYTNPAYQSKLSLITVTSGNATQINVYLVLNTEIREDSVNTGRLTGFIKDEAGKPLGNAVIQVKSGDKIITGAFARSGGYLVTNIPPGTYSVLFDSPTYIRIDSDNNVKIRSGEATSLNAILQKKEMTIPLEIDCGKW